MKQVINQSIIKDEENDLEIVVADHRDYPEKWLKITVGNEQVNIEKSLLSELILVLQKFRQVN
jgi:hypothetical protein